MNSLRALFSPLHAQPPWTNINCTRFLFVFVFCFSYEILLFCVHSSPFSHLWDLDILCLVIMILFREWYQSEFTLSKMLIHKNKSLFKLKFAVRTVIIRAWGVCQGNFGTDEVCPQKDERCEDPGYLSWCLQSWRGRSSTLETEREERAGHKAQSGNACWSENNRLREDLHLGTLRKKWSLK